MKKQILLALAAVLALPTLAQTNFRHITFEEALAAAKAENKMIFIDFYTSWCGPCKVMANQVFPQKEAGDYFNAKFVCVKYDAEKEGAELVKKYPVSAYPTFYITDADGKVIGTKVGGNFDVQVFIADIEAVTNPELSPERVKERYAAGERTAQLVAAYAKNLTEEASQNRRNPDKAKLEEANKVIESYFNSLTDAQKLEAENAFIYTQYTKSLDASTAKFMIANREKFAEPAKEKVQNVIEGLYGGVLMEYLGGKQVDAAYETLKKEMLSIGLEQKFAGSFKLVETRANGGSNGLLDYCEKEYKNMDPQTRSALLANLTKLIDANDDDVKTRASKFVRSNLAEMELGDLYSAVMQLFQLGK